MMQIASTPTPTVTPPAFVPVSASAWGDVMEAFVGQISVSTVVASLAVLVTAGIGLVFMWWGVRKAVRSLMAAFKSGKIRF